MSDAYDYPDADAIPQVKPKAPHALTREQCSLCTANRPRLCDQHYKQGADELLKHVTAAIQDQQTPGGVKATYEQLLELCNQQRQALAQQAQEVERLTRELSAIKATVGDTEFSLRQQLAEAQGMVLEVGELNVKMHDAEQQVARLRKALMGYAECSDGCTCGDGWDHETAQHALSETGAGGQS